MSLSSVPREGPPSESRGSGALSSVLATDARSQGAALPPPGPVGSPAISPCPPVTPSPIGVLPQTWGYLPSLGQRFSVWISTSVCARPGARSQEGLWTPEMGLGAVSAMQGTKHRCPRGWQSGPWGGARGPEYLSPVHGRRLVPPHPAPRGVLQWLLLSSQSRPGSHPPLQDAEWPFPKITQPQPQPPRRARAAALCFGS